MNAVSSEYHSYQPILKGCSYAATHFDPLEKISKISYRIIDITALLKNGLSKPFILLSSQIKNLILAIESTRFFVNAPSLFFPDEKGNYFIRVNTKVKCAEKISVVVHTALKTIYGLDKVGLIRLGSLALKTIANVSIFRWAVEGTILMFYSFGVWDAVRDVCKIYKKFAHIDSQINSKESNLDSSLKKWKNETNNLQIDLNKIWLKIAANTSKIVLITIALTFAVMNLATVSTQLFILNLGALSDVIGLSRIFYIEYTSSLV